MAGIVVRYLLVFIIARLFGAEGLGTYTLAIAFASAAALLGRVGLDRASMRFTAFYRAQNQLAGVVGVNLFAAVATGVLGCVVAVLLALASGPLESAWHLVGLGSALRLVAIAVPAVALGEVWRDGLRGFQDVRLASFLEKIAIPGSTASFILVLLLVRPSNALIAVGAAVGAYWFAALIAGVVLYREVRQIPAAPMLALGPWMSFAVFLSLEGSLLFLLQWSDQLLVGLFLNATDVGIYAAAVRLAALAAVPLLAVNSILGPTVAALHGRGAYERLRQTYARLTWATGASGLCIGLGLIGLGSFALGLFGPEFAGGYLALVIVTVGHIVNAATGSAGVMLGMTGHVRWRLLNAALTAGINVSLNLLLIPAWGIAGSAAATATALITINLLQIVEVRLVLGFWGYDPRELAYWFHFVGRPWRTPAETT